MGRRFVADYGCSWCWRPSAFLSVWTIGEQFPSGSGGGEQVAVAIIAKTPMNAHVMVDARDTNDDRAFSAALRELRERIGPPCRPHGAWRAKRRARALREIAR